MDYYKSIESWATHRGLDKTNPDKLRVEQQNQMTALIIIVILEHGALFVGRRLML